VNNISVVSDRKERVHYQILNTYQPFHKSMIVVLFGNENKKKTEESEKMTLYWLAV
jgi:hypothetical protein